MNFWESDTSEKTVNPVTDITSYGAFQEKAPRDIIALQIHLKEATTSCNLTFHNADLVQQLQQNHSSNRRKECLKMENMSHLFVCKTPNIAMLLLSVS